MLLVTVAFVLASVLAAWLMVRGLAIALDEQHETRDNNMTGSGDE
jgi:hypothetical protein